MKTELSTFNTFPSKRNYYWQITLIPTISILRAKEHYLEEDEDNIISDVRMESYVVFNLEWLFWSATILIK
jgi:hypothetical protein